jgi:hypothetical protein
MELPSQSSSAEDPFLPNEHASGLPVVSCNRWWVLLLYTAYSSLQCAAWATPGALQPQYMAEYSFSQNTMQLLLNYGCFGNIVFMLPSMWVLDRAGLRVPIMACMAMTAASAVMRLFATDASTRSLVLIHASCILNAVAGPLATGCPSKLAEDWFPPHERTLACGIAAMAAQGGAAIVYLMLPLLSPNGDAAGMARIHGASAGIGVALLALALAHFPSLPPQAPSASSRVSREHWQGEKITLASLGASSWRFFSAPGYSVCVLTYAFTGGLSTCQSGLLTQNLMQVGATEAQAGWVGTVSLLGGVAAGVVAARLGDALKAQYAWGLKALLCASALAGALAFTVFAASTQLGWGGFPLACAAFCASQMFLSAQICLTFEVAAEAAWGLGPEGSMLILLVTPANVVNLVGFLLPQAIFFPVANWGTAAVALCSIPALLQWVPNASRRLQFDLESIGSGKKEQLLLQA